MPTLERLWLFGVRITMPNTITAFASRVTWCKTMAAGELRQKASRKWVPLGANTCARTVPVRSWAVTAHFRLAVISHPIPPTIPAITLSQVAIPQNGPIIPPKTLTVPPAATAIEAMANVMQKKQAASDQLTIQTCRHGFVGTPAWPG